MDFVIELEDLISIVISIICGGLIGFEREYKNKSAGFRTILLITLGSTIFTIVSRHGAGADDRISANILTGIGFIGAGVIFKDQFAVRGLTTAAVIWTSAAIGMTTGIGYHSLAAVFTLITLFVLLMVNRIEKSIGTLQKEKTFRITFRNADFDQVKALENQLKAINNQLKIRLMQISKEDDLLTIVWRISGKRNSLIKMGELMATLPEIKSFM